MIQNRNALLFTFLGLSAATAIAGYGYSSWQKAQRFRKILAKIEQEYRPQIAYLQAYRFLQQSPRSREEEVKLFASPEILDASVETQSSPRATINHSMKPAGFKSFRERCVGSIEYGSGTLQSGMEVEFLTYRGTTSNGCLPLRIRFDLAELARLGLAKE